MSIKSRQVAGVTTLVVFIVVALSAYHLATLARLSLQESGAARRAAARRRSSSARARSWPPRGPDPYAALREDGGIRSLLQSSVGFSPNVLYAAIVNSDGVAVAHSAFTSEEGKRDPRAGGSVGRPRSQRRVAAARRLFRSHVRGPAAAPLRRSAVRLDQDRHLDDPGEGRAAQGVQDARCRASLLALIISTVGRDAAGAVDAAADSRDPERPHAPRPRRARRPPGSAGRERSSRISGSSFDAVSAQLSESRAKALSLAHRLRVRRRQPRGRRRALRSRTAS